MGQKNQELFWNFDEISGHNWHKNEFPDRDTLIEQSLTLIERSVRRNLNLIHWLLSTWLQ